MVVEAFRLAAVLIRILWAILITGAILWGIIKEERHYTEIRARINAIEATVEPLAYDSVDYDNRLAKIEGKNREIQEDEDDAGK